MVCFGNQKHTRSELGFRGGSHMLRLDLRASVRSGVQAFLGSRKSRLVICGLGLDCFGLDVYL